MFELFAPLGCSLFFGCCLVSRLFFFSFHFERAPALAGSFGVVHVRHVCLWPLFGLLLESFVHRAKTPPTLLAGCRSGHRSRTVQHFESFHFPFAGYMVAVPNGFCPFRFPILRTGLACLVLVEMAGGMMRSCTNRRASFVRHMQSALAISTFDGKHGWVNIFSPSNPPGALCCFVSQIADGKMRWWTVTSGGQLQASVFSDVKFNSTKASKSGAQKQYQKKTKPKKKKKSKTKYHYGGGGGGGSRNEYNNYVSRFSSRRVKRCSKYA